MSLLASDDTKEKVIHVLAWMGERWGARRKTKHKRKKKEIWWKATS